MLWEITIRQVSNKNILTWTDSSEALIAAFQRPVYLVA